MHIDRYAYITIYIYNIYNIYNIYIYITQYIVLKYIVRAQFATTPRASSSCVYVCIYVCMYVYILDENHVPMICVCISIHTQRWYTHMHICIARKSCFSQQGILQHQHIEKCQHIYIYIYRHTHTYIHIYIWAASFHTCTIASEVWSLFGARILCLNASISPKSLRNNHRISLRIPVTPAHTWCLHASCMYAHKHSGSG